VADATGIDFQSGFVLGSRSGDYTGITDLTPVAFTDFSFSPVMTPSPVAPLWTFNFDGDTYSFDMTSVIVQRTSTLTLLGSGILSITGFDPTPGTWVLTTQGSGADLTFSAASTVPEPGTLLLLGGGLVGLAYLRKRKKA
jgi:hypothetical protein